MVDEVGDNMNQKGDGHRGGVLLACERGKHQKKATINVDKHFNFLGFAAANGEPVMCCVVFAGIVQNPQIETGIDITKSIIGSVADPRCF